MAPKELPGFYWDEEKKKYFKIESRRLAPVGSKYSREALMSAAREEEMQQERWNSEARRPNLRPIMRSRHNLLLKRLHQEMGTDRSASPGTMAGCSWAVGLSAWMKPVVPIVHPELTVKVWTCSALTKHPTNGDICASVDQEPGSFLWFLGQNDTYNPKAGLWRAPQCYSMIMHPPGRLRRCSIAITANNLAISTYSEAQLSFQQLQDPADQETIVSSRRNRVPGMPEWVYRYPSYNHFRASQLRDPFDTLELAIAADNVSFWVRIRPDGDVPQPCGGYRHASDTLCVDWKSKNVYSSGTRNGSIYLHDIRTQGNVCRLGHGTAASKMRWADECRVVVAGPEHKMTIYDIRSVKDLPQQRRYGSVASRPYISYKHQNNANMDLGMDVCCSLGLVAAATDKGEIAIFNLWTGEIIHRKRFFDDETMSNVHSLCFSPIRDDSSKVEFRLAFASNNVVGEILQPAGCARTPPCRKSTTIFAH